MTTILQDLTPIEVKKSVTPRFPVFSILSILERGKYVCYVRHNPTGEKKRIRPSWVRKYRYITLCRKVLPHLLETKKGKRKPKPKFSRHWSRCRTMQFRVPKQDTFIDKNIKTINKKKTVKVVAYCDSQSGKTYTIYEHSFWGFACDCWSFWSDNKTAQKGACKHTLSLDELELWM